MNDLSGIKAINTWAAHLKSKKTQKALERFDRDAAKSAAKEMKKGKSK